MCGISGIVAYHDLAPLVDEGELLRVRDRMVARGFDAASNHHVWAQVLYRNFTQSA
jgi:asparagine synthetase B (glutamine-hydrolysing)